MRFSLAVSLDNLIDEIYNVGTLSVFSVFLFCFKLKLVTFHLYPVIVGSCGCLRSFFVVRLNFGFENRSMPKRPIFLLLL